MGTTQPIRDKQELERFVDYYRSVQPKKRDYALIILGLHTALRISDILELKWEAVYDFGREEFIFTKSTDHSRPLCRSQAFRIVKRAAKETLTEQNVSCHSLRKTFGYHAWKQGTPPALLMDIYNHSSYRVTKRYLGISQDEKDIIYMKIDL